MNLSLAPALEALSAFLPYRIIEGNAAGDPLLAKYLLWASNPADSRSGWRLHLHNFLRSDEDREPHSHPWNTGVSFILSGGYTEEYVHGFSSVPDPKTGDRLRTKRRRRRPFTFAWIPAHRAHRVELEPGAQSWSLFLAGPLKHPWGFFDRQTCEFIGHKEFFARKGLSNNGAEWVQPRVTLRAAVREAVIESSSQVLAVALAMGLPVTVTANAVRAVSWFLAHATAPAYGAQAPDGGETVSTR